MAIVYFGKNANGSDVQPLGAYAYINDNSNIIYTCPAGGKYDLKELGARVYTTSAGNMRLAIYDTSDNLIAQGDAEIDTAPPDSSTWLSHTSFVDADGDPVTPQLDGGTDYKLIIAGDKSSDVYIWCDAVTSGYIRYNNTDLTGGFPATITYGGNWPKEHCIRCGVEAAAGGVALAGTVASVSATSSLLPYITHILIDNKVEAVSSTPTVLPYIYHYLVDNVIAGASSLYGNLTVIVGQVYQMMAGAVNAISSLPSTLPYIYHYLINNVVAGTSSLWGNLTRIVGSVGSNLRIYMKIHRGRF